jgi:hypothetical protein
MFHCFGVALVDGWTYKSMVARRRMVEPGLDDFDVLPGIQQQHRSGVSPGVTWLHALIPASCRRKTQPESRVSAEN